MQSNAPQIPQKTDSFFRLVAAVVGLLSFGAVYAVLVERLERSGHMENNSSWFVAFGTFVTLLLRQTMPAGLFFDLMAFVCSGTPMIAGQMITKIRVATGFRTRLKRTRLKEREWIASRNGRHTARQ